jgi:hypothetical protein
MKIMTVVLACLMLFFAANFSVANQGAKPDVSQQIQELQKAVSQIQDRLNDLSNQVSPMKVQDPGVAGVFDDPAQPSPEQMRAWLRQIWEQATPENRKRLEIIVAQVDSQIKREPAPPADGQRRIIIMAKGEDGKEMMMEKGMPMPPREFKGMPQGPGFLAQLPEPMRENAMLWFFYILTHKPPMDGMPPKMEGMKPAMDGKPKDRPMTAMTAAGPANEIIEQLKKQIAERDSKIQRLAQALEEAKKQGGQPGDVEERLKNAIAERDAKIAKLAQALEEAQKKTAQPGDMEERFKAKLEEMEKRMASRDAEVKAAMSKMEARIKELSTALEQTRAELEKTRAALKEKDTIIENQKKRIAELEKKVAELKKQLESND